MNSVEEGVLSWGVAAASKVEKRIKAMSVTNEIHPRRKAHEWDDDDEEHLSLDDISQNLQLKSHQIKSIVLNKFNINIPVKVTVKMAAPKTNEGTASSIFALDEIKGLPSLKFAITQNFRAAVTMKIAPPRVPFIDGIQMFFTDRDGRRIPLNKLKSKDDSHYKCLISFINSRYPDCITYYCCDSCDSCSKVPDIIVHIRSYIPERSKTGKRENRIHCQGPQNSDLELPFGLSGEEGQTIEEIENSHSDAAEAKILLGVTTLRHLIANSIELHNLKNELEISQKSDNSEKKLTRSITSLTSKKSGHSTQFKPTGHKKRARRENTTPAGDTGDGEYNEPDDASEKSDGEDNIWDGRSKLITTKPPRKALRSSHSKKVVKPHTAAAAAAAAEETTVQTSEEAVRKA